MNTEILVALVFVLLFSSLAVLLFSWKSRDDESRSKNKTRQDDDFDEVLEASSCPLCGEPLPPGERVHSILFPGREFGLMQIYGCSNCWVDHPRRVADSKRRRRYCPSCKEQLPDKGYVMARVYDNPNRKIQVQVYGCTICRTGRG